MKTLIGIVTFGNLPFTQLTVRSIRETTRGTVDFFFVVGKPGDWQTAEWLAGEGIPHLCHAENRGFPASINDIYDFAFVAPKADEMGFEWAGGYDNVIMAGNDVVPYPDAIDVLIETARTTDWEWLCSSQFDVKSLVDRYPETRRFFRGETMEFTDFAARPWEAHEEVRKSEAGSRRGEIEPNCIKDVRNLTLFKRSVFEKIGYADANFWPGGYFEDNDYCTRARLAGVKACGLPGSAYFHFWSRTIHQGGKGGEHHEQFRANERFYAEKWGGPFERERWTLPFDGKEWALRPELKLPGSLKIGSNDHDDAIANFWRSGGV